MTLEPGDRVDRYVLVEPLGEGGQGAVWKARDRLEGDSLCALKLCSVSSARPADLERARREARALARLEHPSLVKCHGLFEDLKLNVLGYAMELVDGTSLRELAKDPRLDGASIAVLLGHVARALGYLHESDVFHRDVKLDNVIVHRRFWDRPDDPTSVKVVDLGIARIASDGPALTQLGTVVGTIPYLAPELLDPASVEGEVPEAARDVFAFGVMGWLLLTGRHPTGLASTARIADYVRAYRAVSEDPSHYPEARPDDPVADILADALAVDPHKRIASGVALVERWQGVSENHVVVHSSRGKVDAGAPTTPIQPARTPPPTRAPSVPTSPAPESKTSSSTVIVGLILAAAAGGGAYFALSPSGPSPARQPEARGSATASSLPARELPDAGDVVDAESEEAAASDEECADADLCTCCPSGQGCGAEGCEALLSNEDFRVRVGDARGADAGPSMVGKYPNAEVCVRVTGSGKDPVCTSLIQATGDHPPSAGLYATAPDLVAKGLDIVVRIPVVDGGALPLAFQNHAKHPDGIPRRALCEGLLFDQLTTYTAPYEVVLYLDPDEEAVPRPCR